jgi:hypothetical protein
MGIGRGVIGHRRILRTIAETIGGQMRYPV